MSLLTHLAGQSPRYAARDIKSDPRYQIALRYFDEITELRERGYTWGQINYATEREAMAEGLWSDDRRAIMAGEFYKKIQKEREAKGWAQ